MIEATKVQEMLKDSLFNDDEVNGDKPILEPKIVQGVMHNFGFHPERLESHREEVKGMLKQLPSDFHKSSGGGGSFLQACVDKQNIQWGEHRNVESLMCLGIGLGYITYCAPKAFWSSLPGGMPYFVIDFKDETE